MKTKRNPYTELLIAFTVGLTLGLQLLVPIFSRENDIAICLGISNDLVPLFDNINSNDIIVLVEQGPIIYYGVEECYIDVFPNDADCLNNKLCTTDIEDINNVQKI